MRFVLPAIFIIATIAVLVVSLMSSDDGPKRHLSFAIKDDFDKTTAYRDFYTLTLLSDKCGEPAYEQEQAKQGDQNPCNHVEDALLYLEGKLTQLATSYYVCLRNMPDNKQKCQADVNSSYNIIKRYSPDYFKTFDL